MRISDLVWIVASHDSTKQGVGLYLGRASRTGQSGFKDKKYYAFLWKGRIATFDKPFWTFEVISETG